MGQHLACVGQGALWCMRIKISRLFDLGASKRWGKSRTRTKVPIRDNGLHSVDPLEMQPLESNLDLLGNAAC